jgi:hypothetical protein
VPRFPRGDGAELVMSGRPDPPARLEHQFGASRTRIWLERVHYVRVATETIQRVFRDIGVSHLVKTRRRRPKQLKLFEKKQPGDSIQADVTVVTRGRRKWVQTSEPPLDSRVPPRVHHGCSRFRFARFRSTTAPRC